MSASTKNIDSIIESVVQYNLESICQEMAIVLRQTAYSPNIKERLDFSCAIFEVKDKQINLISSKDGIPVHLGSMDLSVQAGIKEFSGELFPGDVLMHNSPYLGGTHLPDVTLYTPLFLEGSSPAYFIANRAHHADIGGKTPGSMPGHSETLFEEGLIIPPIKLWEKRKLSTGVMNLLLSNVRTPKERLGDFRAQYAALNVGEKRLRELIESYTFTKLQQITSNLADRAENAMKQQINTIQINKIFSAIDYLDSDGRENLPNISTTEESLGDPVELKVSILRRTKEPKILVDFTGTSPMRKSNCNATIAITRSCIFYVFRYLLSAMGNIPTNYGLWRPIELIIPTGSLVNASFPYATSSGNVETSQRIVDVLFKALTQLSTIDKHFNVPASSQGTMNNVLIGGWDPNKNTFFSYFETLAGGTGADSNGGAVSAIQYHMTYTLNTPIEAIERTYPFRIRRYEIRNNSGGKGIHNGGDGLIREYEILSDSATLSLQTERRKFRPWGVFGGEDGEAGRNILIRNGKTYELPGRVTQQLQKGDIIQINTPGGGGFGKYN